MSSLEKGGEPLAVEGLTNNTSIASLSIIRKYVEPTTAKAVPRPC